uniref:Uncharacterized protein n=1 Tax=Cyclopterus lumpus TaxID=8103 RepID=A0A8C2YZI3_CYCLU
RIKGVEVFCPLDPPPPYEVIAGGSADAVTQVRSPSKEIALTELTVNPTPPPGAPVPGRTPSPHSSAAPVPFVITTRLKVCLWRRFTVCSFPDSVSDRFDCLLYILLGLYFTCQDIVSAPLVVLVHVLSWPLLIRYLQLLVEVM